METIPVPDDTMPSLTEDGYASTLPNGEKIVYSADLSNSSQEPAVTHYDTEAVLWYYREDAYRTSDGADHYAGDKARDVQVEVWRNGWTFVGRWRLDRGETDDAVRFPDLRHIVLAAAKVLHGPHA
jgi:hypothetical protein